MIKIYIYSKTRSTPELKTTDLSILYIHSKYIMIKIYIYKTRFTPELQPKVYYILNFTYLPIMY